MEQISRGVGRPTKFTDDTVIKLEEVLKVGGTIEEATSSAGISRETYYRWLEENPDFMTKMEYAQHYADIEAKNIVVADIIKRKNTESAKWWLEKRQFKNKLEITGKDGDALQIQLVAGIGFMNKKQPIDGEVVETVENKDIVPTT